MTFADTFGIALPIVQAPVGGIASPELAAAVSNAGALGSLALTWHEPPNVREALRAAMAATAKPVHANFVLDFEIDAQLDAALEAGCRIISFFWGDPARPLRRAKAAGARVICIAGSVAEARRAADLGADAVVAQGMDAGGHVRGTIGTFSLVPAVVDAVSPLPVLAAGGIADARGVAAAFALGASGVWVGTRFVASAEANVHPDYVAALVSSSADDTVYSELFDGGWPNAPLRTLRNSTVRNWQAAGSPPPGQRPGENEVAAIRAGGDVLRYESDAPNRQVTNGAEAMALYSGQGVGLIRSAPPARDIVAELARGLPPA